MFFPKACQSLCCVPVWSRAYSTRWGNLLPFPYLFIYLFIDFNWIVSPCAGSNQWPVGLVWYKSTDNGHPLHHTNKQASAYIVSFFYFFQVIIMGRVWHPHESHNKYIFLNNAVLLNILVKCLNKGDDMKWTWGKTNYRTNWWIMSMGNVFEIIIHN